MHLATPVGYSHKMDLNLAWGWGSLVLYLSPTREAFADDNGNYLSQYAGKTMCPGASPECFANCLIHSGQMIMPHAKKARVRKTRLLIDNPEQFGRLLTKDIDSHLKWCKKNGMFPSFRFNGTSDFPWESWPVPHLGVTLHEYIHALSPVAVVNEYTKRYSIMKRWIEGAFHRNLHMTFSLHEQNELQARSILKLGGSVAVVFRTKKGEALPPSWWGRPVFDGDGDDLRWMDRARARAQGMDPSDGLIVGLRAKGKLARTVSPFAVDPTLRTFALPMAA